MAGLAARVDPRAVTPAPGRGARAGVSAATGRTASHPLWAVVLAGGEGRRLRPLVRHIYGEERPKQYATLTGSRSLLGHTLDRVKSLVPPARTVVVALKRHRRFIDAELEAGEMPTIVLQPVERGTAPGVLLPVRCILAREPGATVAIFPSDHFVEPAERFLAHVADAARFVDRHPERIVLIGIAAADAETEYGWIRPAESLGCAGGSQFWGVERFVEKPSVAAARACLASGGLWNTFVIVARGAALAEAARQLLPAVHERVDSVIPFLGTLDEMPAVRRAYAGMPHTSLSHALLERCTPVLAVSALEGVRWCDWGAPHRVVRSLDAEGIRPPWLESFRKERPGREKPGPAHTL
jgi:mannose-1-phosphate guanylyltransferase